MKKRKRNKQNGAGVTTLSIKPPQPRASVLESDVMVPAIWAALLAGSIGLVATLVALAARTLLALHWPWWLPLVVGGSTAAVVFCWRCTVAEGDRRALLLWPIEAALGQDLDQDGWIGEPEGPEVEVEPVAQDPRLIYVHSPYKQQHDRGAADFRHFLRLAYGARGSSWRTWDGEPLPSGKVVTRPVWDMWCGRLLKAGLASRDYPTAPLQLSGGYRDALHTLRAVV